MGPYLEVGLQIQLVEVILNPSNVTGVLIKEGH